MSIDRIGTGFVPARQTKESAEAERPGGQEPSGATRPVRERADSVEISTQGRSLARGELDPARLEELRGKVRDGTYNRPNVAENVARRILASGDVI